MYTSAMAAERGDDAFLFEVYAANRSDEFAALGLSGEQLGQLLAMQHRIQQASYARTFPTLEREIVFAGDRRVGQWCVAREPNFIRLVDIALLPAHRGRGFGTALIRKLQNEAARSGCTLLLSVRPENRARRLYERLGFRSTNEDSTSIEMEWRAAPSNARS